MLNYMSELYAKSANNITDVGIKYSSYIQYNN